MVRENCAAELEQEVARLVTAGDEVAGARPPLRSGRPPGRGGAGGRHLPRSAAGHPGEPGPGPGRQPPLVGRRAAALARAAGRRAGEPRDGERGGDHRGRAAGSRPRAWSWATPPTARASSRRCSRWGPTWRSGSPRPAGTRRAGGRSRARRSTRRWARRTQRWLGGATARTAGRPLAGGGGIVPDVLLRARHLHAPPSRGSRRALDGQLTAFRDVLTRVRARASPRAGPCRSEDFLVDRAMRDEVRRAAGGAGRPAGRQHLRRRGADLVDQQLGYEVARYRLRSGGGATAPRERRPADRARRSRYCVGLRRRARCSAWRPRAVARSH